MQFLPPNRKTHACIAAIPQVKTDRCQGRFCQLNLTRNLNLVENRVTYSSFFIMGGGLKRLVQAGAAALMLGGAAEAQEATNVSFEALDPAVVEQIATRYRECIAIELDGVDENGNGIVDPNEDVEFYQEGEEFCQKELAGEVAHAEKIAAGEERIAALNDQQAAAEHRIALAQASIEATTARIIAGAKAQSGL